MTTVARPQGRKSVDDPVFFKRNDIQDWWKRVTSNPNFEKVLDAAYSKRKFKKDLYDHEHQQLKADHHNEGFADALTTLEKLGSFKPSKKQQRDTWDHAVDPDLDDALKDENAE